MEEDSHRKIPPPSRAAIEFTAWLIDALFHRVTFTVIERDGIARQFDYFNKYYGGDDQPTKEQP